MRGGTAIVILACAAAASAQVASSWPADRPSPTPATRPVSTQPRFATTATAGGFGEAASVLQSAESLVAQLGDPRFERREAAQRQLRELGEAALPVLLAHLADPDEEVARRIADVLPIPRDGTRRVDVAMRLLSTGRREHLRQAVVILFMDPAAVVEEFRRASAAERGVAAAMCAPILEQLTDLIRRDELHRKTIAETRRRNPAGAERVDASHAETRALMAETAYWLALDARDEYLASNAATQPVGVRNRDEP